jgi:radical SAM superfamily enzyme YgiQ (UPF0313 family)
MVTNYIKTKRYGIGNQFKRIYLVAPRHPESFWSMQGTVELLGAKTLMPNAALPTLMALTPFGINVEYVLCDENVSELDWNMPCDLVVITGATLHKKRIHELCAGFRQRGVKIALGGAYASINNDQCSHLADYLFIGEAEYTWPIFLHQWIKGNARSVYHQKTYVDLKDSPTPDWSLIDVNDYININVQTSRGCPNNCEFCDVIQYVGRKPRTKSVQQVMREVRNAHSIGARTVFFSDDNFLANKTFTEKLLVAIIEWNKVQTRPLSFSTQITVEIADDEKLLRMCADARFSVLFLGVETVRRKSLEEVKKFHNLKYDIFKRVNKISRYGIMPFLGMIVGFDNDDESVFAELEDFITRTNSPIAGISLLNAPRNTPLYKRMEKENRLIGDDFSGEWQLYTNIIPKQISREVLLRHYCELFKKIYDPEPFHRRLQGWLKQVEYSNALYIHKKFDPKQFFHGIRMIRYFLFLAQPAERKVFFKTMVETGKVNPKLMRRAFTFLAQYHHFYDFVRRKLPERI